MTLAGSVRVGGMLAALACLKTARAEPLPYGENAAASSKVRPAGGPFRKRNGRKKTSENTKRGKDKKRQS